MGKRQRARLRRAALEAERLARCTRDERARELLLSHLTEEQARTYVADGFFEQRINQRWYCFHEGTDSVMFILEQKGGPHLAQLCTHLSYHHTQDWPADDVVLAHKLMAEADSLSLRGTVAPCWRFAHQSPTLRGPQFQVAWCRSPLPPEPFTIRRPQLEPNGIGCLAIIGFVLWIDFMLGRRNGAFTIKT